MIAAPGCFTLGAADPDVNAAVHAAVDAGYAHPTHTARLARLAHTCGSGVDMVEDVLGCAQGGCCEIRMIPCTLCVCVFVCSPTVRFQPWCPCRHVTADRCTCSQSCESHEECHSSTSARIHAQSFFLSLSLSLPVAADHSPRSTHPRRSSSRTCSLSSTRGLKVGRFASHEGEARLT
jgi:hypothetical protein